MSDFLDMLMDPNGPAISDAERKRQMAKLKQRKTGHAWRPGTGPDGEYCKTCEHLVRKTMAKTYLKCRLMKATWTGGAGSDVKANDPACKKWEPISSRAMAGDREDVG